MTRTPEQKAADEALTTAVTRCVAAYGDGSPAVVCEYVVAVALRSLDDDGEALTTVGLLYRDSDVPTHRALGLVEYAAVRLRGLAANATRTDDDG